MNSTDDSDILIEGSRNLDDGTEEKDITPRESEDASKRVLNQQGIFVLTKETAKETAKPLKELSQELFDEGGIEIIRSDEEEESYL